MNKYQVGDYLHSIRTGEDYEIIGVDTSVKTYTLDNLVTSVQTVWSFYNIEDPLLWTHTAQLPGLTAALKYRVGDQVEGINTGIVWEVTKADANNDTYDLFQVHPKHLSGSQPTRINYDADDLEDPGMFRPYNALLTKNHVFKYSVGDVLEYRTTGKHYKVVYCDSILNQYDLEGVHDGLCNFHPVIRVEDSLLYKLHMPALNSKHPTGGPLGGSMPMNQSMANLVKALEAGNYLPSGPVAKPFVNKSDYPHQCPKCAAPAYIGFSKIDCSNGSCTNGIH